MKSSATVAKRVAFFAAALLWPAGTWRWWEAWLMIGIWSFFAILGTVHLFRHDPQLAAERLKSLLQRGQKSWDQALMAIVILSGVGLYVVPGLDVVRYRWSEPFPLWVQLLAFALHVPSFAFLWWVMRTNTYLSCVVKIDRRRDHRVVTSGPYRIVRHPMYGIIIVLVFAMPVALGSRFALIPAGLIAVLLVARTSLEDRTLHEELPGYREYANHTRFRLLPGMW